jgi:UDP-N-acetylglucosamine--N-acetylmuramyl-(pentapeptide) pyrophosphoryl-undecaprenol N-acetylglucosamine transferase
MIRSHTYVFTGGGTAGHVTPIVSVAEELAVLNPRAQFVYIGAVQDPNNAIIRNHSLPWEVHEIPAGKFRRYHGQSLFARLVDIKTWAANARDMIRVFKGFLAAYKILSSKKVESIFMKGGYVGVPVCMAARLLKIPYVTHDSDAIAGLANRLVGSGAVVNAVGTDDGKYPYRADKVLYTGIPISREFIKRRGVPRDTSKELLGIPPRSLLIVCILGTQGAKTIDDALEKILPSILAVHKNTHALHVFGRLNEESLSTRYRSVGTGIRSRIHTSTFITNAPDWIAAADIVVGRAGATSLLEIAAIGRAMVIVPAEHLTGGHQIKNAKKLEATNAAVVIKEKELEAQLESVLSSLIADEVARDILAYESSQIYRYDAATKLAEIMMKNNTYFACAAPVGE